MGWYGTYCNDNLKSIKVELEREMNSNQILDDGNQLRFELLYHSFKFGKSYMAIRKTFTDKDGHNQDVEVYAVVRMWTYSKKDNQLMIKTIDESCGPCYYDPPMRLLKMLTKPSSDTAYNWRVACWSNYKNIPKEYRKEL